MLYHSYPHIDKIQQSQKCGSRRTKLSLSSTLSSNLSKVHFVLQVKIHHDCDFETSSTGLIDQFTSLSQKFSAAQSKAANLYLAKNVYIMTHVQRTLNCSKIKRP